MSRIGNKPIQVADDVQIALENEAVMVKGSQGELNVPIPKGISVRFEDKTVYIDRANNITETRALHGLMRCLVQNAVTGVSKPWEKKLEVIGTGFRVKLQGKDLIFDVGYSHSVKFPNAEGVQYGVQANLVTVSGANKQLVGEVANKIKSIRKPDPYKGKGIRYAGEFIKLKPGKKAKTA